MDQRAAEMTQPAPSAAGTDGGPAVIRIADAQEVLDPDLGQVGGRRMACDVAAEFAMHRVGADHHRDRVPAQDGQKPSSSMSPGSTGYSPTATVFR